MPTSGNPLLVVNKIATVPEQPSQPVPEFPMAVAERIVQTLQQLQETLLIVNRKVSLDVELWDIHDVASYFKRSVNVARQYVFMDGFPVPIQLPSTGDSARFGHRLWMAKEVIAWGIKHKGGGPSVGRPRQR